MFTYMSLYMHAFIYIYTEICTKTPEELPYIYVYIYSYIYIHICIKISGSVLDIQVKVFVKLFPARTRVDLQSRRVRSRPSPGRAGSPRRGCMFQAWRGVCSHTCLGVRGSGLGSHELATFQGEGSHFCGRVARLVRRQRSLGVLAAGRTWSAQSHLIRN